MTTTRLSCPECGERAGLPILWGLPHPDAMDREDVVFGGCVVPADPPSHVCQSCGHRWASKR